jgi:hypothetical protein
MNLALVCIPEIQKINIHLCVYEFNQARRARRDFQEFHFDLPVQPLLEFHSHRVNL